MPRKVKSSLVDHHFPRFYACYLLKSIRTPRATATYIGSTPSPPRRIRQHNGEITQGAWKTQHNRPWVMQMIVYGFPSKLTALQFEWAWQHPHISRHLRDEDGKAVFQINGKSRYLKTNVSIARSMICSHPYNTWPLHVKLFTAEAEKAWNDSARDMGNAALPRGFTCTLELEGVDGKSGSPGTGRKGPIDVHDTAFISAHLNKWTALLGSGTPLSCSVCNEPIARQHLDPLNTALCPTSSCAAVSHLSCLCADFLAHERAPSDGPALIPRGGACRSCRGYVLWGDVVRGCYRRRGNDMALQDSDGGEDADAEDARSAEDVQAPPPFSGARAKRMKSKRPAKATVPPAAEESDEGEVFDLDNVSSSSEDSAAEKRPITDPQRATSPPKTKAIPARRAVPEKRRPKGAVRGSSKLGRRTAGDPPIGPPLTRSLHNSSRSPALAPRSDSITHQHAREPARHTPTPPEYDEGLSSSHLSPPSRAPRAAPLRYVELSDSDPAPPAPLSLFADDPAPARRLSRALSSLSLSSGSELPSTAGILRDLCERGRGDVIEVSD